MRCTSPSPATGSGSRRCRGCRSDRHGFCRWCTPTRGRSPLGTLRGLLHQGLQRLLDDDRFPLQLDRPRSQRPEQLDVTQGTAPLQRVRSSSCLCIAFRATAKRPGWIWHPPQPARMLDSKACDMSKASERSMARRIGAYTMLARHDAREVTQATRAAFENRFTREVDPEGSCRWRSGCGAPRWLARRTSPVLPC